MRWINRLAQLSLCASVTLVPFAAQAADEDPWESVNRPIFKFNDVLDTYALKPLAQGYQAVTPQFVIDGIHNMYRNIGDVQNLANDVLQFKPHAAGVDTSRIFFNTIFGVAGFFDVGTKMGLQRNDEDFGQTLGHWGVGSGPYVVIPFFGPSTLRDAPSKYVDTYTQPWRYMNDIPGAQYGARRGSDRHPHQPVVEREADHRRQVHFHPQRLPAEPRVQGQGRQGGRRFLIVTG